VPGSVAKSTHAGLPWLRFLRESAAGYAHFWPFDGWTIQPGRSVVAEVYPTLCRHMHAQDALTNDQQDAYAAVAWLKQADLDGSLTDYFRPSLNADERRAAEIEGWILGVK